MTGTGLSMCRRIRESTAAMSGAASAIRASSDGGVSTAGWRMATSNADLELLAAAAILETSAVAGDNDDAIGHGQAHHITHRNIGRIPPYGRNHRSEEHTSEIQSLKRISYAVFC